MKRAEDIDQHPQEHYLISVFATRSVDCKGYKASSSGSDQTVPIRYANIGYGLSHCCIFIYALLSSIMKINLRANENN